VASKVPESAIRQALAEIKQGGARYPARVFTSRMKSYAAQQADTRSQSLHSAMQKMQKKMTLN
jgi:muramoyltetrapeptide carboxypeptidase LdcA involved in peptidoglycan recycling